MNKYYIKFGISRNNNAGSKAIKDIMFLLDSQGYRPVLALPTHVNKIIKLIDVPLLIFTLLLKVRRSGIVVYFVPSNYKRIKLLKFFKKIIGYKLICFINDIESLRMDKSKEYAQKEMNSIACADIVWVPNDNSVRILQHEYNFQNLLIPVGVWDFLNTHSHKMSKPAMEVTFHNKTIAFAGNLLKSPFVKDLYTLDLNFKIWGNGSEIKQDKNIQYMGVKFHDELIKEVAACSWGLVWDGDSINSCTGTFGSYLRFNNSHKCGLYLAAGIPIIVWRESGMASFVNKHNAGICVSSLQEAEQLVNEMTMETYIMYRENAQNIGSRISEGKFFLEALAKAESIEI